MQMYDILYFFLKKVCLDVAFLKHRSYIYVVNFNEVIVWHSLTGVKS